MPAFAPMRQRSPMRDHLLAAAGQRAHDRRAAADVRAVADDDAGRDAALDHRGPEGAGVVVDEALVHDRGALGQVGAEPHPVGVGDPHPGRQHVVDHARELVDAVAPAAGPWRRSARRVSSKSSTAHGPADVHTTLGSTPKIAVEVDLVRARRADARAGAGAGRRRAASAGGASRSMRVSDDGRRRRRDPWRSLELPLSAVSRAAAAPRTRSARRGRAPGTRCRERCPQRRRWPRWS